MTKAEKADAKKGKTRGRSFSSVSGPVEASPTWQMPMRKSSSSAGCDWSSVSKGTRIKRAQDGIDSRNDSAFFSWWREARTSTMQIRSSELPSAHSRMEALRARVVAREKASRS